MTNDWFKNIKQLYNKIQELEGVEVKEQNYKQMIMGTTYDVIVTDSELKEKTYRLFKDGHHARAVEEAFKFLDNLVYKNAKIGNGATGEGLMRAVFSPNKPILKLNENITESQVNEQRGYMDIMAGSMTGIRNPRAHDSDWEDTEERALQLLGLANHLVGKVKNSNCNIDK